MIGMRVFAGIPRAMRANGEIGRIIRFVVVGVSNTLVGLSTIYACKYFFDIADAPANAIGYCVGLVNSFIWNRRWTFRHSGEILPAVKRFLVVFLVAYMANLLTAMLLINETSINHYLAHAIATVPYTVIFYLGSRFVVFKPKAPVI